jgi:hypothetical protein
VAEGTATPARNLHLGLSSPNPFAAATEFEYTLPADGRHMLAVYHVQGRQVALLADRHQTAGHYKAGWDGRDARGHELPSGSTSFASTPAARSRGRSS